MEMQKTLLIRSTNFSGIRSIILIFLLTFSGVLAAQENALRAYKGMTKTVDLRDRINKNCTAIEYMPSDNIEPIRSKDCHFKIFFSEYGEQSYKFYSDSILLDQYLYDVDILPDIRPFLAGGEGGYIPAKLLQSLTNLELDYDKAYLTQDLRIANFTIEVYREKELQFRRLNMRGKFNTEIKNLISRVEEGDIIHFKDVEVLVSDFDPYLVEGIKYRVTD